MKLGLMISGSLGIALSFAATLPTVFAGEVLRLKSGNVRIDESGLKSITNEGLRYFVIQYTSTTQDADRSALAAHGVEIQDYLPEDAYLVRGRFSDLALLAASSPRVRAVSTYASEWKLSPAFLESGSLKERRPSFLLSLGRTENVTALARVVRGVVGVQTVQRSGGELVVQAPYTSLSRLAAVEGVLWIEPLPMVVTFEFHPFDEPTPGQPVPVPPVAPAVTYTGFESGTKNMGFEAAWSRGYRGAGQIASLDDTGVDRGDLAHMHSDLTGNVTEGVALGFGGHSWEDPMGHGTHVCGSVVGNGASSGGQIQGGANAAHMFVGGLWSPILANLAFPQEPNKLVGPAYTAGARVNTNSWGNPNAMGDYDALAVKYDQYVWDNPDMLVLFAAGNSGVDANRDGRIDEGSVTSPATAKNVLTVGASENTIATGGIQKKLSELREGTTKWGVEPLASDTISNNPNGMAMFSSRGPTKDGRLKPDIVAPGTNIVSTRSHHPTAEKLWGEFDAEYLWSGGTSMATPLVAGAATVTREYLIKAKGIANPSAALVKATLLHTAFDMYPGQYGTGPTQELPTRRPNVHEGYGRVNMDDATNLATDSNVVDERVGVKTGETKSVSAEVGASGTLRATLTYTDAPGAAAAATALVNDIDLRVTGPGGFVKELQDRKNNTEMVELTGLTAGIYQVSVVGINVPRGKADAQPYALVVSH